MNILFMHPTFPGQHVHLAQFFAQNKKNNVAFIAKTVDGQLADITQAIYTMPREPDEKIHPYLKPIEEAVLHGQGAYRGALALREQKKFIPDVIVAHSGWGDALYMKDLYPNVPLLCYFEWFYNSHGSDVGYFPGEEVAADEACAIRTKNAHHLLSLYSCDAGYSPTHWQKKQFPNEYLPKISVLHDGIDTNFYQPKMGKKLVLPDSQLDLTDVPELITYVSRGFEAYRGFPQFMEALVLVLRKRPKCHVVIVGEDRICYGAKLTEGKTYKEELLKLLGEQLDMSRVHFTGYLAREKYLQVLQASTVHVYLTRPFVLSWSMLEAMSAGCCLISSKTPPVEEVLIDGVNGLLANFNSPEHIAMRITEALEDREMRTRLSHNARETILECYELQHCLRKQANFIYSFIK